MTMTAVAVQQNGTPRQQYNPRQSHSSSSNTPLQQQPRSQSSAGASIAQIRRQEAPLQNGTGSMNSRSAISNDPVQVVNGDRQATDNGQQAFYPTDRTVQVPGNTATNYRLFAQERPNSAPNGIGDSSDSEADGNRRNRRASRPRALLHRAKSDFGPFGGEEQDSSDDSNQVWGARHGFEDHYASEEYVSQLANVGSSFPSHDHAFFYMSFYLVSSFLIPKHVL